MPKSINSITIIITLEGIEEINKNDNKNTLKNNYFFHQCGEKTSTNFEMASRF